MGDQTELFAVNQRNLELLVFRLPHHEARAQRRLLSIHRHKLLQKVVDQPQVALAQLEKNQNFVKLVICLLYTSPSPRDQRGSRMPSSA